MHSLERAFSRRSFVATGLATGMALATRPILAHSQVRSSPMETTIRAGNDIATQINICTVEPENQHKLMQLLKDGTEGFFSKQPGWISTNLLSSKDGRRVLIYSQWRTAKDIEAFRQNPNFGPYLQDLTAIAKFETMLCDVAYVHHA
jgi:hypothetical protein